MIKNEYCMSVSNDPLSPSSKLPVFKSNPKDELREVSLMQNNLLYTPFSYK